MNAIDSPGRPDPDANPTATVVRKIRGSPKGSPALELQVSIVGRNRTFLLLLDELASHGLSGPEAVEELRGIRVAVEKVAEALTRSPETG